MYIPVRGSLIALATCALCAVAPVARATTPALTDDGTVIQRSMAVHLSDLDLDRSRDVAKLFDRISLAAAITCSPATLTGSNVKTQGYERCYSDAVNQAVWQVHRPELTNFAAEELMSPRGTHAAPE